MARNEKMSVGRFLKRNTLYLIPAALLLLLAAALITVVILLLRSPGSPPEPSQEQTAQTSHVQQTEQPEVFQPPFEGTTKFLAGQKLALTYDEEKLQLTEDSNGLYSLTPVTGESTPRMDLQRLYGALDELSQEDLQWLAVSMVQEYYFMAPPAEKITLQEEAMTDTSYTAVLEAPAYLGANPVRMKLQLLQIHGQLWYVTMLLPEGCDSAAVEQAYDNLVIR